MVKITTEQVVDYLEKHGCKLLSEYIGCRSPITILCSCGHERISKLEYIKKFRYFSCKKCTIKREQEKGMHPDTFKKIKKLMETLIKRSLKYRNDFDPENYNKTKKCNKCNREKKRYYFRNNRISNGNPIKMSVCKVCENILKRKLRENPTIEQKIRSLLNTVNLSLKKGRSKESNIDFDYLMKLYKKQFGKCRYQGISLALIANHINTLSLDRIDPSKGYIKGNVQFVSKSVNSMKSNLSEEEFFKMTRQIYRYQHITYAHKNFDVIQATKHIKKLFKDCKTSIKKRGKAERSKECLQFDLTIELILELIVKQGNRCAYTGKELIWLVKHNYSASIDRIDSSKGYTLDNIQLVCKIANQAKNNLTHEQFLEMVNNIYNNCIESNEAFLTRNSSCDFRETSFLNKLII